MNSLEIQVVLLWAAVTGYVVATIMALISLVFRKPRLLDYIPLVGLVASIAHTAAIILRWTQTGHFPYWGRYEVFSSYPWALVLMYLVVVFLKRELKVAGVVIFPIAFFMTGMALTGSPEVREIPNSFLTYWLGIHIAFAKLAFGSALLAAFYGILYLLKEKASATGRENILTQTIKDSRTADYLGYRFTVFAFVTMTIMIGAGAVWGYKAWGRYWGWDPVETWSLVCWFVYGIILHLRTTLGWKGRRAAWISIGAIFVVIFAFFGLSLLYSTIHEHLEF